MNKLLNTAIALIIFALLSRNTCYAADELAAITARLEKTPVTYGEFKQEKHLKVLQRPLISTGNFTYEQHLGVIWKTLTPVDSILLVNESKLVNNQGEQALPPSFGRVFQAMLGGDLSQLSADFLISAKNDKSSWRIQLQPKEELVKKIISTIELSGDTELRSLNINETNGNQSKITFDHITHLQELNREQQADFKRLSP